jgi:hypothetical protein
LTAAVGLAAVQVHAQAPHRLECPSQAPAEWGMPRGNLIGVQVLSARRDEAIDEAAPPDLIPDRQTRRGGVLHQIWQMNADGPDWQYFVWCRYAGTERVVKLAAPGVTICKRELPAAHPDRPPQRMVCN